MDVFGKGFTAVEASGFARNGISAQRRKILNGFLNLQPYYLGYMGRLRHRGSVLQWFKAVDSCLHIHGLWGIASDFRVELTEHRQSERARDRQRERERQTKRGREREIDGLNN